VPRWRKGPRDLRASIPGSSRSAVRFAVRIASLPQRLTAPRQIARAERDPNGRPGFCSSPSSPNFADANLLARSGFVVVAHDTLLWGRPPRFDVLHAGGGVSVVPAPLSGDRRGREARLSRAIITYCFVALCLARSSSAGRISRMVGGTEDNIETRCSFVHGRSPASAKAGDHVKSRRTIVRNQFVASGT
jgi:hypothetical protein